jgi:hypothetical protein
MIGSLQLLVSFTFVFCLLYCVLEAALGGAGSLFVGQVGLRENVDLTVMKKNPEGAIPFMYIQRWDLLSKFKSQKSKPYTT